jgi:hypothetical protein
MSHSKFAVATDGFHKLFSTPSLTKGEDATVYAELYALIEDLAQPMDVWEQMMVSDVANHFWEQQRYRRCTGTIINSKRRDALKSILQHGIGLNQCDTSTLLDIYFDVTRCGQAGPSVIYPDPAQIPDTRSGLMSFLKSHGYDETDIERLAMERSIDTLVELENLALKHEIRREAILRELELRRERRRRQQPSTGPRKLNGKLRALTEDSAHGRSPPAAEES